MATRDKKDKRESPVQFRPGEDLYQLIADFAAAHNMEVNEASKLLVALAVVELDARFFGLITEMASAMGGTNSFSRSCVHIKTAMQTVARLRPEVVMSEPERIRFILDTITAYLHEKGRVRQALTPWDPVEASAQEVEPSPVEAKRVRRIVSGRVLRSGERVASEEGGPSRGETKPKSTERT